MPRRINEAAAALAREVAAVVSQVSPRDLCTSRVSQATYTLRGGLYYDLERSFPNPPLRAHVEDHVESCADCMDYRRWRVRYAELAEKRGVEVLPDMVAPATIDERELAPVPHLTDPDEQWLALIGTMIRLARSS